MHTSIKLSRILACGGAATAALTVTLAAQGAARLVNPEQTQPLGTLAPMVLSTTNLESPNVKAYRPWFENGSWQGDIGQYDVSSTGALTSSLDYTGTTPVNVGDAPANWSALVTFKELQDANDDYWETDREIITWDGSGQVAFTFSAATIGTANMELIDELEANDGDSEPSNILNYIRGDRSNEFPSGDQLRARVSVLGDIIHNKPVYVGAPAANRTDDKYRTWASALSNRAHRVYAGANDGMLHVFDVTDGSEVYAYIPSMLMGNLRKLADVPHQHTYFVDGHLTVTDAFFDSSGTTGIGAEWHSVLVGTLGAGGKGIFALDVTNPDLSDQASSGTSDQKILWEHDASADDDLGYTYAKGVIARLNDDKWYVVTGNGYSSVNGKAVLYIMNIATGQVKKLSTGSGSDAQPNGLSSPVLLDIDRDGKVDTAYAGDIDGDLWKFDLSSDNPNDWGWDDDTTPAPLYDGLATQPITVQPKIGVHPNSGYILYFATGKLLSDEDRESTDIQAMMAIHDDGGTPPSDPEFHDQTWDGPKTYTGGAVEQTIAIYNPDAGDVDWTDSDIVGWRINFPAGYRVTRPVQIRGNRIKATVFNPNGEGTSNYLLEAALPDGGPHTSPIYDLNEDQVLDEDDRYDNGSEGDAQWHVPMIWHQDDGFMSEVTIARIANGVDTLFINYLVPPIEEDEECIGDECEPGGLQGGHIDLDTWHRVGPAPDYEDPAYAGVVTKHEHQYDKHAGRVYVDFFDLNIDAGDEGPPREDVEGQVELDDDSDIEADEKFIVLLINADFSPGGVMTLGTRDWHVWEYQRAIHMALKNWDATLGSAEVPTYDPDGDGPEEPIELVFTLEDIQANGGTLRHSFSNMAILQGGLHPTQPSCQTQSAYERPAGAFGTGTVVSTLDPDTMIGRWRNGALTTQLVKASHFNGANPAISRVLIQKPTDLRDAITVDGVPMASTIDFNGNGTIEEANHEIIGGAIAASGEELLWESTLYWHFGALYDLLEGVRPCYEDDPDGHWAKATALEQSNDPISETLERLDDDSDADLDFSEGLEDAFAQVSQCIIDEVAGIDTQADVDDIGRRYRRGDPRHECIDLLRDLRIIENKVEEYTLQGDPGGGDNGGDNGGDDGEADPIAIGGDLENIGDTEGTGFPFGRMSWTDVVD